MLVLSRKEGETIEAGGFEIVVVQLGEDIVQLRISHMQDKDSVFVEVWVGVGEDFRIGKQIVGRIAVIRFNAVGIVIEAPRDVVIMRGELVSKMSARNERQPERRDRFPGIH